MHASDFDRRKSWLAARPRQSFALLLLVLLAAPGPDAAAGAAGPPFLGKPLSAVLEELQRGGLPLLFSTALVKPEMTVSAEPAADEPRGLLAEILRPHGLAVLAAPGGQLVVIAAPLAAEVPAGSIRGRIDTEIDPSLLATVRVRVEGTELTAAVSDAGVFEVTGVPAGEHTVTTDSPFFQASRVAGVAVRPGEATAVRLRLMPAALFLSEIVVTPSHLRIVHDQPESRLFLSREEVNRMPHAGDDLLRALKRMPGTAGSDFSAKLNIRGGEDGEVLVLLDGLELNEPFHLKDFQSMFSTVDSDAVGGVDFLTGGFPVEYGDRMSGVMDISVDTPAGEPTTAVSVSTIQARVLSQGSFDAEQGQWLVCARGWYPDAFLELAGATTEEIRTDYYDLLAKVQHRLGKRSLLAVDTLWASDDLAFTAADEEETEHVGARYRSHHLWANLRTDWSDALFSETVLAGGRVKRERDGGVEDAIEGTLAVDDRRTLEFLSLRQDWRRTLGDRHLLKWGLDFKGQEASYEYTSVSVVTDPALVGEGPPLVETIDTHLEPEGQSYGAYLAERFRPAATVVVEVGARWDRQTWVGEHQLSPRANVLWSPGPRTTLRVAWGRFWQSQRLNELQVEDGVTEFYPAQRAEHVVASVEQRFTDSLLVRLEAYDKRLSELRPRWENLFNPLELFPESRADRILVTPEGGRSRGVELSVRRDGHERLGWWASYALARADDRIDGAAVPRSWDQRHAASVGLDLRLPHGWSVNLGGTFHSGWPTTSVTGVPAGEGGDEPEVELVPGPRNGARYPDYYRLDLRAGKTFTTRAGEVTITLEVLNLTDRRNLCCVEDFITEVGDDGEVVVTPEYGTWAPMVPSLGVQWRF